jgi:hypothetical protein
MRIPVKTTDSTTPTGWAPEPPDPAVIAAALEANGTTAADIERVAIDKAKAALAAGVHKASIVADLAEAEALISASREDAGGETS